MSHGGPHHDRGFHHHPPPVLSGHPPQQQQYQQQSHATTAVATPQIAGDVVKIYSEADSKFNLGVRGGEVVMLRANDSDPYQQWIKDESWSYKAKDSTGQPAFALINVGSGKALKRAPTMEARVSLENYHKDLLNDAVLWTMSTDHGKAWHALRPVNDINLNLDIQNGTKEGGGVHDGHPVLLFKWKDRENQHWQIATVGGSGGAVKSHSHQHLHF